MPKYSLHNEKRLPWLKILLVSIGLLLISAVGGVFAAVKVYHNNLQPASASEKRVVVTIPLGSSVKDIAVTLKQQNLIKSTWAFEQYVRYEGVQNKLQAGTYSLQPSLSVQEIVNILTQGDILTDLITIIPGERLDQVRAMLINRGFNATEVAKALNPDLYRAKHPSLADLPKGATLEGYLYPESIQKTDATTPGDIINKFLDQMDKHLTPQIKQGIKRQGLSVHQGVIIASMVEQEVSNPNDKPKVAQVFIRRLKEGIPLGSDITAPYGAILDGATPSITYDSAYNTHKHTGLPPGPISNFSESSLKAVSNPAKTDYLFFVAGDDGVTHFSHTEAEHEALVAKYCKKLCGQ